MKVAIRKAKTVELIDKERISSSRYYAYNGDNSITPHELEQEFYVERFFEHVDNQNERNIESGHKERNQTIEEYYQNRKTCPEEVIFQIGDKREHATADELWDCAIKYKDDFKLLFEEQCEILTMFLYDDGDAPCVHIRRVWIAEDEYGDEFVNKTIALRFTALILPDETRPEDRCNNRETTFLRVEKELIEQICEGEGLVIEHTPSKKKECPTSKEFKEGRYFLYIPELEKGPGYDIKIVAHLKKKGDAQKCDRLEREIRRGLSAQLRFCSFILGSP